MISINTNLSSFIAQNSLKTSTNKLNETVERMSTGYKINHAKDNAANYSISTNMTTQLNSYHVAQDNIAMGMDLVTTASDTISLMQNKAERLRALCTQARNGTYGAQSLNAINGEANAIIAEINRIYMNAEYNGIKFFEGAGNTAMASAGANARATNNMPEAKYNGFIDNPTTYSKTQIDNMASIDSFTDGASGEFKIEDADDLAKLATIVDADQNHSNATFVLANDIDLTDWQNQHGDWNPIGDDMYCFQGTFDGNGHVVKNMRIAGSEDVVGLFAYVDGGEIKNLGVINANVSGNEIVGVLAGTVVEGGTITNCYVTGDVEAQIYAGGLVGVSSNATVTNSYATGDVSATQEYAGGLVGYVEDSIITNCYATGDVSATQECAGGLVGYVEDLIITNCYATGDVEAQSFASGLVGAANYQGGTLVEINNCYTTGDVNATQMSGGLVGLLVNGSISNSYATGNINATQMSGGLVGGGSNATVTNSYATGNVDATQMDAGGLVGLLADGSISNSYATGNVNATQMSGGLVGVLSSQLAPCSISDSYAYGTVTGTDSIGSLVGALANSDNSTNTANYSIVNCQTVAQACDPIGGFMDGNTMAPIVADLTPLLAGITVLAERPTLGGGTGSTGVGINLQVGIYGNQSCGITLNTGLSYDLSALAGGIESDGALQAIDDFINLLSDKATHFGAVQNRLESALDSIEVNIMNLTSSRSTIRDADMAELSSTYIQQQILQEASATLMATANQMPAIALQLL